MQQRIRGQVRNRDVLVTKFKGLSGKEVFFIKASLALCWDKMGCSPKLGMQTDGL